MSAQKKSGKALKKQLEDACEDLWWSSESDYPIQVVWQPQVDAQAEDQDGSIDQWLASLHPEDAIETVDFDDFFARSLTPKSWHTPEDQAQINRLTQLHNLLTSELSHLQVYRCGEIEVAVYVLGYSDDGILSGVQTTLVET